MIDNKKFLSYNSAIFQVMKKNKLVLNLFIKQYLKVIIMLKQILTLVSLPRYEISLWKLFYNMVWHVQGYKCFNQLWLLQTCRNSFKLSRWLNLVLRFQSNLYLLFFSFIYWYHNGANLSSKPGPVRELNPGPLAPEARIIPLDQQACRTA